MCMGWVFRSNTRPRGGLRLSLLLASPMLGGCASQPAGPLAPAVTPPGIEFSVEQGPYSLGDTITMVLANESDLTILYNWCHVAMERDSAGGWEGVSRRPMDPAGGLFFCPDIGISLRPGGSASGRQPLIEEMESGVYRFQLEVRWGGVEAQLISNEFGVDR